MPQFDPAFFPTQIFWLAVAFLALYYVMVRYALPRVSEVLETRRSYIEHDLEAAERLKSEAEAALTEYEKMMATARTEAQTILRGTAEELAAEIARRHGALADKLAAQTKTAEARIAGAKQEALADIKTVAAQAAMLATEKLVGAAVDEAKARAAVDAAMAERK